MVRRARASMQVGQFGAAAKSVGRDVSAVAQDRMGVTICGRVRREAQKFFRKDVLWPCDGASGQ